MNFLIDFYLYAARVATVNKRLAIHLAWLQVFVTPLNTLNNAIFGVYYPDVKSRAKRTGQKILLEYTLNAVFNQFGLNQISIDNSGDDLSTVYFYNYSEGYPNHFFYNESEAEEPFYFYNSTEFYGTGDFVVMVPTAVFSNYSQGQITSEVDKYRPAGTSFSLKQY